MSVANQVTDVCSQSGCSRM